MGDGSMGAGLNGGWGVPRQLSGLGAAGRGHVVSLSAAGQKSRILS